MLLRYFFYIFVFIPFSLFVYADAGMGGVVNTYAHVERIEAQDFSSNDTLFLDQINGFFPGDLVLLIQMKGALLDINNQFVTQMNAAGKYEVLEIESVDIESRELVLNAPLLHAYDVKELVQLIRIPRHKNIRIVDTLRAQPWNGQTGGILALIADHRLVLDAPVDVTGAGMRGAQPDSYIYQGTCFTENSAYDRFNFLLSAVDSAGLKGEGALSVDFLYLRGKGNAINGGGGGNGMGAGGYGGGNAGEGGRGGNNVSFCSEIDLNKPIGGKITDGYYTNSGEQRNRLFTGGGGGGGTQLDENGATAGGSGGGIVFMLADTLVANGFSIIANGRDVDELALQGGAGGGGGGGTIVLDVDVLLDSLHLEARGGTGGYVQGDTCFGPGGGGGGGFLWVKRNDLLLQLASLNLSGGESGYAGICGTFGASSATQGTTMSGLNPTLNGFLFNMIQKDQTICQHQIPEPIIGSQPKGGSGGFAYLWQYSDDIKNWSVASFGSFSEKDFMFYQALTDTLYVRRIVQTTVSFDDTRILSDTSAVLTIAVLPELRNNLLADSVYICSGQSSDTIYGDTIYGGNGSYQYQWMWKSYQADTFYPTSHLSQHAFFESLWDTTYFYRSVESGPCQSASDTVLYFVLPAIENNNLNGYDYACLYDTTPLIQGSIARGGDGRYIYQWEQSSFMSFSWDSLCADSAQLHFQSASLSDTVSYRRIVFSGPGKCCKDTSGIHTVKLIEPVSYNVILPDSSMICRNTRPNFTISGTQPHDGAGNDSYQYTWLVRNDTQTTYHNTGVHTRDYQPDTLTHTSYLKRVVVSEACRDTSSIAVIALYKSYHATLQAYDTVICSGDSIPARVTFTGAHAPWRFSLSPDYALKSIPQYQTEGSTHIMLAPDIQNISDTLVYRIQYSMDTNNCDANSAYISGAIRVLVHNYPIANAGDTQEVCQQSGFLRAEPSYGTGTWSLLHSDGLRFADVSLFNAAFEIENTDPDSFQLQWKESNWLCENADTTLLVYYPPPVVHAGEDIDLYGTRDTVLNASPLLDEEQGKWEWLDYAADLKKPDKPNSRISNLQFGSDYQLVWYVEKGVCPIYTDTVLVSVNEFFVPNAFSPNGDGINDYFEILGLENAARKELIIFNRWGNILFQDDDYKNDWDGTIQGRSVQEGVYYYVIHLHNERGVTDFKGFFVIKR